MSKQRASSRVSVLSKAMKYVDEETRQEFRDKRILSLENDNCADENAEVSVDLGDEDDYENDSEDEQKKKKTKYISKKKLKMMGTNKWYCS